MADMIKFYRGQLANLPEVGALGAMYITTDEGGIYYGTGEGMKRLGDFVQVANVASLPESGANQSALYYCAAENILAKWNGSSWSQINKDTGMTAVEVVGDGNAVTAAEYNAETRKLTMTKGATYATPAVVDSKISTAVGTLGTDAEGNAYANVKAYVDAKTSGIATDAALGELQQRVTTAEGEIDVLQEAVAEGGFVANAIAEAKQAGVDAKGAADAAQADVDELSEAFEGYKATNDAAVAAAQGQADKGVADAAAAHGRADEAYALADSKATMTQVNEAIAGAGHAVKSEVDQTIADMDAAYKKADSDLETKLQGNIDKKADQTAVDAIVADYLKAADKTELEGKITAEENARKAADEALDERLVDVEAFFKLAEGEKLDTALDTLVEIQTYLGSEGAVADQMLLDIAANKAAHEKNAADIAQEIKDREAGDKALSDRIDAIHTHDNKGVLDGISAEKVAAWDAAQVNVIETVKVNGVALTPDSAKAVDVIVPTGALASKDEVAKTDLASALVDEINAKAVAVDVNTELAKKVDKVEGKSLIADSEITRLAGMSDGANKVEASATNGKIKIDGVETVVYTHPANHAISEVSGLQEALNLKLEAADIANKADKATTLAGYGITNAYTKDEIDALLSWGSF